MNLDELVERAKGHTQAPDDPPTCCNCGDEYSLNEGCEVTDPSFCDPCAQELAPSLLTLALELRRERDLAVAHDRQPYPTAEAYEKACEALHKWQTRAEAAEAELTTLRASLEQARKEREIMRNALAHAEFRDHHYMDWCDGCNWLKRIAALPAPPSPRKEGR